MHELINALLNTLNAMGYPGIFVLMAMESSIIPVPSEFVMPPAGYLAHQGQMNIWIAIIMGTLGS
ncbi:MAG: DedA family protein, partial [Deltaproteobacteria bacterium HGW-Deltaproteobacteria-10]